MYVVSVVEGGVLWGIVVACSVRPCTNLYSADTQVLVDICQWSWALPLRLQVAVEQWKFVVCLNYVTSSLE